LISFPAFQNDSSGRDRKCGNRRFADVHGGRIEVESKEGCGSTFRIVLALKDQGRNK
jgi:hypothetical protein